MARKWGGRGAGIVVLENGIPKKIKIQSDEMPINNSIYIFFFKCLGGMLKWFQNRYFSLNPCLTL